MYIIASYLIMVTIGETEFVEKVDYHVKNFGFNFKKFPSGEKR